MIFSMLIFFRILNKKYDSEKCGVDFSFEMYAKGLIFGHRQRLACAPCCIWCRKKVVATARRCEGACNRAGKPSVPFCGEEERRNERTLLLVKSEASDMNSATTRPVPQNPAAKIDALHRFLNAASSPFIKLCTNKKQAAWPVLCWYTLRGSFSAIGRPCLRFTLRTSRLGPKIRGGKRQHRCLF